MAEQILTQMSALLQKGKAKEVRRLAQEALDAGIAPEQILNEGLLSGMMIIGEEFRNNKVFVPEVLVAARAMTAGTKILEEKLVEAGVEPFGRAVMGTVKGDLHDIGKNLVIMMLKAAGFEVFDLGVDVDADTFLTKAEEVGADIIGMSALLTTTMPSMKEVIDKMTERGIRDKYIVMIGGAPVTQDYADRIGADIYTEDAASAAQRAKEALLRRRNPA